MWFRMPSGTLVNLDKVSRIGISERSPEMRTGARYRVYAVDDSTDYTKGMTCCSRWTTTIRRSAARSD